MILQWQGFTMVQVEGTGSGKGGHNMGQVGYHPWILGRIFGETVWGEEIHPLNSQLLVFTGFKLFVTGNLEGADEKSSLKPALFCLKNSKDRSIVVWLHF